MLKRLLIGSCSLLLASSIHPLFADYSDLETVAATVEGDRVAVQVQNPTSTAETARIQVAVRVEDGSIEVLTIPTVTVQASSSAVVTASASAPIVAIIDDPEPISP